LFLWHANEAIAAADIATSSPCQFISLESQKNCASNPVWLKNVIDIVSARTAEASGD